ncbi:MAG TPA: MarR family transcriptional regulator [Candidatus Limnocylindria bacterium]|nr:MarR family transcriptional regulator [Candidatus Limnocylindria bacterium]
MPARVPTRPPSQADARAATQLLGFFPWVGSLWHAAVREAGAGSIGRYKTFGILHGRGPIRAGELATLCGTTPSATSEVIEGLAADGLVRRIDDPTDRRAVIVELTAEGEAELARVGDLMTAEVIKRLDGLSGEQKVRVRAAISDLTEILIAPTAQKETRNVR